MLRFNIGFNNFGLSKNFSRIFSLIFLIPFFCFLLFFVGIIKSYNEIKDILGYVHEIFLIFVGTFMFFYGFKEFRKKQLIENIPTSKVRSVAMGLAELKGKAVARTLLKSPITLTDCVYYKFKVEKESKDSKGRKYWVVVKQGCSTEYFYLDDGTGKILVDPLDAEVILPIDYRYIGVIERFSLHRMRYTEYYIKPDEEIYILGTVKKIKDEINDRKTKLVERLKQIKQDKEKLKEFDTNKNGKISVEEWDKAVEKIEQEVLQEEIKEEHQVVNEEDLVICKNGFQKIMMISDQSEQEITKKIFLKSILLIFFGGTIIFIMSISLISRIGFLPEKFTIPWETLYVEHQIRIK